MQVFANNVTVFVNQLASSVATEIALDSVASLPIITGEQFFTITFFKTDNKGVESDWEVVKVTAINGNKITCVRGFDGTAQREWLPGAVGQMRVSRFGFSAMPAALATADAASQVAAGAAAQVAQLAGSGGAGQVGFQQSGAGAVKRTVEDELRERVSIKGFGASVVNENNTVAVQGAINAAITAGIKEIEVPDGSFAVPGALTNRSNVVFVGPGKLTGAGAYRTKVIPKSAPSPTPFCDLVPSSHLRKMSEAVSPIIVFTGDSTAMPSVSALDASATPYHILKEKITTDNPGVPFAFYNRAVAGMDFFYLNDKAWTNFPDWYADVNRAWLDYIKDLSPDVVVIQMGMNDSNAGGKSGAMRSVVAKIKAWLKVPDIVFVTTPVPTLEPHANWSAFGTKDGQEGRDYIAGYVRSYAKRNGYGLIDINRMANMARDGRDILACPVRRVAVGAGTVVSGAYQAPADLECRDFSMLLQVTRDAAFFATFLDATHIVRGRVGANAGDLIHLIKNGAGNIRVEFFTGEGADFANYANVDTNTPVPTANCSIQVEKRGNELIVLVNGTAVTDLVKSYPLEVHGGVFRPQIGWASDGMLTGPFSALDWFQVGEEKPVRPTITNDDLWGVSGPDISDKLPFGGNGVNHASSVGTAAVYEPPIRWSNWQRYIAPRDLTLDSLRFGTDATIKGYRTVVENLAFAAPAAVPGSVDQNIIVGGVLPGDTVTVGSSVAIGPNYIMTAFVLQPNYVTVRLTQIAGAPAAVAATDYRVACWRH